MTPLGVLAMAAGLIGAWFGFWLMKYRDEL